MKFGLRINYLTRIMTRHLPILVGFVLFLISCESTEKEEVQRNLVSEEHAALIGTWQESDSLDSTIWTFDQYEVKWKGFTHVYRVSGDSLIISGMVYQILDQTDEKMKIVKLNGKPCTLTRKD